MQLLAQDAQISCGSRSGGQKGHGVPVQVGLGRQEQGPAQRTQLRGPGMLSLLSTKMVRDLGLSAVTRAPCGHRIAVIEVER